MSLTEISVRVAIVTLLALAALIAIGWRSAAPRYPGRSPSQGAAHPDSASNPELTREASSTAVDSPFVDDSDVDGTRRRATRKLLDIVGLGSIAAFVGIVIALLTSLAVAWMVTALLARL